MRKYVVLAALALAATAVQAQWFETFIGLVDSAAPNGLAWSRTQNQVFCTNSMRNTVAVIDGATNSLLQYIDVGQWPSAIVWNSIQDRVYFVTEADSTVSAIDCASGAVTSAIKVGFNPRALAYDSVHDKVFCANQSDSTVSVIDCASNSVLATLHVGPYPYDLAVASDVNRVYCAVEGEATVAVINTETNQLEAAIEVGSYPWALAYYSPLQKVYCASFGMNSVDVIDANTNGRTTTIQNVGLGPNGIGVGGAYVYCANMTSNDVAVIEPLRDSLVRRVPVGSKPERFLYEPVNQKMFCTVTGAGSVAVFDRDGSLLKTMNAGDMPKGMALNRTDLRVYAASYGTDTIYVFRDSLSGVEEIPRSDSEVRVELRPQPAGTVLHIAAPGMGPCELRVFDCAGVLVRQTECVDGRANVPLHGLRAGVYVLELSSGTGRRTARFTVAR
jgi:YVTN family beta-propeller protein